MKNIEERLAALEAATGVKNFNNEIEKLRKQNKEQQFELGCDVGNLIEFINDMLDTEAELLDVIKFNKDIDVWHDELTKRHAYLVDRAYWLAIKTWAKDPEGKSLEYK